MGTWKVCLLGQQASQSDLRCPAFQKSLVDSSRRSHWRPGSAPSMRVHVPAPQRQIHVERMECILLRTGMPGTGSCGRASRARQLGVPYALAPFRLNLKVSAADLRGNGRVGQNRFVMECREHGRVPTESGSFDAKNKSKGRDRRCGSIAPRLVYLPCLHSVCTDAWTAVFRAHRPVNTV